MSSALLLTDGWFGLRGWHWLFIIEGLPAILMGLALRHRPPAKPSARPVFLANDEKNWLEG